MNLKNFSAILLLLLSCFITNAQTGKANIDLNRDEALSDVIYSKQNGLWVFTKIVHNKLYTITTETKITKFSPDLSKMEWENPVEESKYGFEVLSEYKNPSYLYLFPNEIPNKGFVWEMITETTLRRVLILDPNGKIKEFKTTKDELKDEYVATFCGNDHLYEVWTKKKSDNNDLIIIGYDNKTFRKTRKTITITKEDEKIKHSNWLFGGIKDSVITFVRHEKKEKKNIEVILANINTGKIISQFTHEPVFTNPKTKVIENQPSRYNTCAMGPQVLYDRNKAYGNNYFTDFIGDIKLSDDGNSFYYYANTNNSGKSNYLGKAAEGFVLEKLSLDGKLLSQVETPITDEDILKKLRNADIYDGSLTLTEYKDKTLSLTISAANTGVNNYLYFGFQFDANGKIVDECSKGFKVKGGILKKGKAVVNSVEDLYPCFAKNTDVVTKYITEKKFDAKYSLITDDGANILTIAPVDSKQLGIIYFKD